MSRIDGRTNDQLRPIEIIPHFNKFAEGSCLIRCGNTQVLCCASVEDRTPTMWRRERAGSPPSTPCSPGPTESGASGM